MDYARDLETDRPLSGSGGPWLEVRPQALGGAAGHVARKDSVERLGALALALNMNAVLVSKSLHLSIWHPPITGPNSWPRVFTSPL